VPDQAEFAVKPTPAGQMIVAALDAGIDARWVTSDEAYGQDPMPAVGLAPAERRSRSEEVALLRLGLDRDQHRSAPHLLIRRNPASAELASIVGRGRAADEAS
jgi:SRSO17 transposase